MVCKCGKEATHKGKAPIRSGRRTVISQTYYWCQDCVVAEKARTPGVIAVPLKGK